MAEEKNNNIQYFKHFLSDEKNKRLLSMLRSVMAELATGLSRSSVFFVRVQASNANSYTSFEEATVDAVVQRNEDSFPIVAPFVLFYVRGYVTLEDFLDRKDPKIPQNIAEQQALQDLLEFLTDANGYYLCCCCRAWYAIVACAYTNQPCKISGKGPKEQSILNENKDKGNLADRIVQHLLVPLAPHKTFMIDSYPGLHLTRGCQVQHAVNWNRGETSFGCTKGWHGRADILMGDEIPFAVVATGHSEDTGTVSVSADSSVEVKKGDNFSPESISQVTAQTVVNSFVQHKKKPKLENTLVPGIGICSKTIIVNLYDCVEDILVTTGPVDLFARLGGCTLNLRAVIILWLGLNHGLFGNKTPARYKSYTADFHRVLGPVQLEAYKNESEQPFNAELDEQYSHKFFLDLNEETADSLDDVTEYITNRMHSDIRHAFVSLK